MKDFARFFHRPLESSWGSERHGGGREDRALYSWSRHLTAWHYTRVRFGLEDFGGWGHCGALIPGWVGFFPVYKTLKK